MDAAVTDPDEDPGYLPIKPGDRVFIEYDDPKHTETDGGWGTVVKIVNAWYVRIQRDGVDEPPSLYGRWLLMAEPSKSGITTSPASTVPPSQ